MSDLIDLIPWAKSVAGTATAQELEARIAEITARLPELDISEAKRAELAAKLQALDAAVVAEPAESAAHIAELNAILDETQSRSAVGMIIEFDGEIFRWDARDDASWYFTAVPPELSEEIREIPRPYRGFGSVRVRARVGGSEWSTSIFPDPRTSGSYVLPLKKKVRDAEGLVDGGPVIVRLEVLDG